MTILTAVSIKSLHLPTTRVPKWPRFDLGERLSEATEAYARAVSGTYLTAMGLPPDARPMRDPDY